MAAACMGEIMVRDTVALVDLVELTLPLLWFSVWFKHIWLRYTDASVVR